MNQIIIHVHESYLDPTLTDLHETHAFPVISSINCSSPLGKLLKSICCPTFCHYKFKFEVTVKAYMLTLGLGLGPGFGYIAISSRSSIYRFVFTHLVLTKEQK